MSVATAEPIVTYPSFPDYGYTIDAETIVHVARPVVEFVHAERPDAIIAADRGGRLLGIATHATWRALYPEERFPTRNGSIQFARLSRRGLDSSTFDQVFYDALQRAGIETESRDTIESNKGAKVVFVDDWLSSGSTLDRIASLCTRIGIKDDDVSAAVMIDNSCGGASRKVVVGDPEHRVSSFDWPNSVERRGVSYPNGYIPQAYPSETARSERRQLRESVEAYFQAAAG